MAESGCVRKLGCVVLAILILCCSRALCGTYGGGTGTEADPYIISTDAHLQELSANSGDWGQCFKLTADITAALYTPVTLFTGQFDGNHHTISDFSYTSETAHYRGFFCRVEGHGAVVKNLTLIAPNVNVPTRQYVGAIAGRLRYGVISGCSVIGGSVRGHSITGGIVGHNFTGSVIDCFSSASVVSGMRTGGIVGSNDENSYITGCVNQGSVTASSDFGGGIAGENLGYLTACYSSGNVTGINYVGGLIGTNGTSGRVAPVVRCFSESPTSGTSWVGGLIGRNASGPVSDSFAAGAVAPVNAPAAGLIARNESTGTVARCYSRGAVTKMGSNFGGLIGQNLATASAIAASFWDTQTSGQTTSAGGTGRTTEQMQQIATYTAAGWDFVGETANGIADLWRLCPEAPAYPRLVWLYPATDTACPDGVEFIDFAVLAESWMQSAAGLKADFDGSGTVDILDMVIFVQDWLAGLM